LTATLTETEKLRDYRHVIVTCLANCTSKEGGEQTNIHFTKYHTTNKCTNCMSFILNHFFKTLFTAPYMFR